MVAACATHSNTPVDPEQARIERLARRLNPVVSANGLSHALARGACGGGDQAGVALYLLDSHEKVVPPKGVYVEVKVYSTSGPLSHQRFDWQDGKGHGSAELCAGGECTDVTSGYVQLGDVAPGRSVKGELDLRFTNKIRVTERFNARLPGFICG